jgi:exonuclease III
MTFVALLFLIFLSKVNSDNECPVISKINETTTNSIRIIQYNTEWLFTDYYSNSDCPGNGCTWKNLSEANIHMKYVSEVVQNLNPDIMNICEVEGCDELNELNKYLNNSFSFYLKKGTDTSTGQNVGMLTKITPITDLFRTETKVMYPIEGSECGYNGTSGTTGVSKHFITEFKIHNMYIAFISAHLLAQPIDPERCAKREAQALILQEVIYDYIVNKNYEVIMIGDFNDYDNDIPDINNNKPISHVLDILKGTYGYYYGKYILYSVSENIPQKQLYTEWWDSDNNCNTTSLNDYSTIDHILVTNKIQKLINNTFVYHGYNEYCGKYNSDHYPIVIDLVM